MGTFVASAMLLSQFTIDVRSLDAIKGGPIILEVTATYVGSQPLYLTHLPSVEPFQVIVPEGWTGVHFSPVRQLFYFGPWVHTYEVRCGHKVIRKISVHHQFAGQIPVGRAILTLDYELLASFRHDGESGRFLRLRKSFQVEIRPITPQVVDDVRKDIARVAATRPNSSAPQGAYETAMSDQADRILGTSHKEFVPLALDVLRAGSESTRYSMRTYLWRSTAGATLLYQHDFNTLRTGVTNPRVVNEMFSDWRQRERTIFDNSGPIQYHFMRAMFDPPQFATDGRRILTDDLDRMVSLIRQPGLCLPDEYLQKLKDVKPLWLRAFVYVTFADRLTPEWRTAFLKEVEGRVRLLPKEQVQKWIENLGSEDFKEREQATAKLEQNLDRVAKPLHDSLKGLSPEATKRAVMLLKKTEGIRPREPYEAAFFDWIKPGSQNSGSRDRILKVIAAGDPAIPFVQDAQKSLAVP